ncbi:Phosphatidate cytidylyltransferase [Balamuthia mandrillaris]
MESGTAAEWLELGRWWLGEQLQWPVPLLFWLGLLYVLCRAFFQDNHPTFAEEGDRSRNHRQRLLTAAFYGPFVLGATVLAPSVFLIFLGVMIWKGLGEFVAIVIPPRRNREEAATKPRYRFNILDRSLQVLGVLQLALCHLGHEKGCIAGAALSFLILVGAYLIKVVYDGVQPLPSNTLNVLCCYVFGFVWISWTLSHAALLYHNTPQFAGGVIAVLLTISWIGDSAAYYIGSRFGRHKAMKNVSPNKSWEGILAEVFFAVMISMGVKQLQVSYPAFAAFLPPLSHQQYVVMAVLTAICGVIGDALESLFKRLGCVKDSGVFFPGHGGVCDRFDTFFFNGCFIYYFFLYHHHASTIAT